jgi:endonuclease/exonuclease/phosphatase (EEP) superfamily protein YafD
MKHEADFNRPHAKTVAWLAVAILAAGCGLRPPYLPEQLPGKFFTTTSRVAADAESCERLLSESVITGGTGLDSTDIRLLSWNTQKGGRDNWQDDFDGMSSDRNLVLLQEAVPEHFSPGRYSPVPFGSFAPGYASPSGLTGVLTLSATVPLTQCRLEHREPWLRTRKATSVTEYALSNSTSTLAVINVHAINFSLGINAFSEQLGQISDILKAHEGPVIVSGDFNTWSRNRLETVQRMAQESGLRALVIPDDGRSTFFGKRVDHVFVRGLQTVAAATPAVETSDHNPIVAVFRVL